MVSLLELAKVTEEGVRFLSPHDGSPMFVTCSLRFPAQQANTASRLLTPEHSISLQNSIGSDIIMQLDDVIATTSPDLARMQEAMHRSIRWLDRCIAAHQKPDTQNLFCIIQGGLDLEMRRQCCEEMIKRDTPGIAIGGLSGGEVKDVYCKVFAPRLRKQAPIEAKPPAGSQHAPISYLTTSPDTSWASYVTACTLRLSQICR